MPQARLQAVAQRHALPAGLHTEAEVVWSHAARMAAAALSCRTARAQKLLDTGRSPARDVAASPAESVGWSIAQA